MITGSIWEKVVFGRYLFAPAFFWEDVVQHAACWRCTRPIWSRCLGGSTPREQMLLALAAYATYVVNATQFLLKLRAARLASDRRPARTSRERAR